MSVPVVMNFQIEHDAGDASTNSGQGNPPYESDGSVNHPSESNDAGAGFHSADAQNSNSRSDQPMAASAFNGDEAAPTVQFTEEVR
jgi:hypothetical protein